MAPPKKNVESKFSEDDIARYKSAPLQGTTPSEVADLATRPTVSVQAEELDLYGEVSYLLTHYEDSLVKHYKKAKGSPDWPLNVPTTRIGISSEAKGLAVEAMRNAGWKVSPDGRAVYPA